MSNHRAMSKASETMAFARLRTIMLAPLKMREMRRQLELRRSKRAQTAGAGIVVALQLAMFHYVH
jgi:hypothetical protein